MHLSWAMSFAIKKYYYKKPGMINNAKARAQYKQESRAALLLSRDGKRIKNNKGTKREQYHPEWNQTRSIS